MGTGASDSLSTRRHPLLRVSGLVGDIDDDRIHGKDERILATSLWEGHEFLYRLVKVLATGE